MTSLCTCGEPTTSDRCGLCKADERLFTAPEHAKHTDVQVLAKQAGGHIGEFYGGHVQFQFSPDALAEFTRLVRERALEEAAMLCDLAITHNKAEAALVGLEKLVTRGAQIQALKVAEVIRSLK